MARETSLLMTRNFGIMAHIDAGKTIHTRSHYRPHCSVDVPPMRAGGSVQRNRPPAQRHGDSHRTRATLGNARSRLSLAQPRLSGENPLEPPSGDEAIAPRRASPLGWDAPSPSGSLSMGGIPAAIEPKRMQAEQACSSNSLSPAWPCILLHLRRTVGQNLPRCPAMQRLCPRALFCFPLHFHAENGRMDLMHPGSRPPPTCFRKEPLPPRGFFKSISIATWTGTEKVGASPGCLWSWSRVPRGIPMRKGAVTGAPHRPFCGSASLPSLTGSPIRREHGCIAAGWPTLERSQKPCAARHIRPHCIRCRTKPLDGPLSNRVKTISNRDAVGRMASWAPLCAIWVRDTACPIRSWKPYWPI